jgi:hypothetical protein
VDLQKTAALANIGSFLVGCGMLYIMQYQPQSQTPSKGTEQTMVNSMMWIFLVGLLIAGAMHIAAAVIANRPKGTESKVIPMAETSFGAAVTHLPDGREIISCDLGQLGKIHRTNTLDQANRILRGKWVRMSGEIDNNHGDGEILLNYSSPLRLGPLIYLQFTEGWTEQLSMLSRGSKVTIRGCISVVDVTVIKLTDCELL